MDKRMFGEVPEPVHNAVLEALDVIERGEASVSSEKTSRRRQKPGAGGRRGFRMSGAAAACIACLLLSGVTVGAVGLVNHYKQRMQDMTREDMEAYYNLAMYQETSEMSRPYTEEERDRYDALKRQYERDGRFPEAPITRLQDASDYAGEGVALVTSTAMLCLPDAALSDEDLLQIIDYHHKVAYSIQKVNEERITSGSDWQKRMAEMDDEEVDRICAIEDGNKTETSGGYSRPFTEEERARYEQLLRQYEEEGVFAEGEIAVIQTPGEFAGEGIAICVDDGSYYFPDGELSDGELLKLIDFEHKSQYCLSRRWEDMQMGFREWEQPPLTPEEEEAVRRHLEESGQR